jgi:hypothetical protein
MIIHYWHFVCAVLFPFVDFVSPIFLFFGPISFWGLSSSAAEFSSSCLPCRRRSVPRRVFLSSPAPSLGPALSGSRSLFPTKDRCLFSVRATEFGLSPTFCPPQHRGPGLFAGFYGCRLDLLSRSRFNQFLLFLVFLREHIQPPLDFAVIWSTCFCLRVKGLHPEPLPLVSFSFPHSCSLSAGKSYQGCAFSCCRPSRFLAPVDFGSSLAVPNLSRIFEPSSDLASRRLFVCS